MSIKPGVATLMRTFHGHMQEVHGFQSSIPVLEGEVTFRMSSGIPSMVGSSLWRSLNIGLALHCEAYLLEPLTRS